jgi:hypothetical protein
LNIVGNMGATGAQSFMGDVNCDGIVNADDLAEVTAHLGQGSASALLLMAAPAVTMAAGGTPAVPGAAKTAAVKRVAPRIPVKAKRIVHEDTRRWVRESDESHCGGTETR